MRTHLRRDLESLRQDISQFGRSVEEAVGRAMTALFEGDLEAAREVIVGDETIDRLEIEIEEDCLKILALHQPVAADLRYVVAAMKANNDLERAADLASNIAERALEFSDENRGLVPSSLTEMSGQTLSMLRRALTAWVDADAQAAMVVIADDQRVDDLHGAMYEAVGQQILDRPEARLDALRVLSVSRYLERISDLATNIAEDVVFMVEGRVIRHQDAPQPVSATN